MSETAAVDGGEARRAVAAATAAARSLGLAVEEAVVLNDSNRLVVRLLPCDVVARIAPSGHRVFAAAVGAEREMALVRRLAAVAAPVAAPEPGDGPSIVRRDGFEIGLLRYDEPAPRRLLPPQDYADGMVRLHRALRGLDVEAPHFIDRVSDVRQWVERRDATPDLTRVDRALLIDTLTTLRAAVAERRRPEQLLHGEPHPWNVLDTQHGPRFIDFENCVRGPVEWDLGWAPAAVADHYVGADREVVALCRGLVLAVVAAHGWRPEDERPGRGARLAYLRAVRAGPPWPALDAV